MYINPYLDKSKQMYLDVKSIKELIFGLSFFSKRVFIKYFPFLIYTMTRKLLSYSK